MNTMYSIDPAILAAAEHNDEYSGFLDLEEENSEPKAAKRSLVTKAQTVVKKAKQQTQRVSKTQRVAEFYKNSNGDKQTVIAMCIDQLGMSKAGATTYFYNAKKGAQ
jgi:mannitol-specific phosphotransferase system IIBC component